MEKVLEANSTQIPPIPESGVIHFLYKNVDEGHIHQKVHSYFVKFWPNEDPNVKSKIEEAVNLIEKMNQDHFLITEKIKEKMFDRDHVISRLKWLSHKISGFKEIVAMNKETELDPLLQALDKLSFANDAYQDREVNSNSSAELNIYSLHFRMLHKSNSLAAEKLLLREIKASQRKGAVGSCSSLEEFNYILRLHFDSRRFSNSLALEKQEL